MMSRKMEIEFERGPKFVATLFDKEAPKTCNFVWNLLPLEELKVVRATSSGDLMAIPLEGTDFKTLEYVTTMLDPGLIGLVTTFYPIRPMNRPYTQIAISFGKNLIHQMLGLATPINRFAEITEEKVDELTEVATHIAEQGTKKVTIRPR